MRRLRWPHRCDCSSARTAVGVGWRALLGFGCSVLRRARVLLLAPRAVRVRDAVLHMDDPSQRPLRLQECALWSGFGGPKMRRCGDAEMQPRHIWRYSHTHAHGFHTHHAHTTRLAHACTHRAQGLTRTVHKDTSPQTHTHTPVLDAGILLRRALLDGIDLSHGARATPAPRPRHAGTRVSIAS